MEVSDVEWKSKGSEMKQDVSRWMGLEVDGNCKLPCTCMEASTLKPSGSGN